MILRQINLDHVKDFDIGKGIAANKQRQKALFDEFEKYRQKIDDLLAEQTFSWESL